MGKIASIEGNVAAVYFGLAVVSTMLAAMVFDQRLIWDSLPNRDKNMEKSDE